MLTKQYSMKRKLIIITTALLCISFTSLEAQKSSGFIKGGINIANISITNDGSVDQNKSLIGFQVGFMGDLPMSSFFSIQPGIQFTSKGSKTQSGSTTDATYYRATTNPMYIEVPVNAVFKIPFGEGSKFFFGAGPYIAMGVAGKNKVEGKFLGSSFSSKKNIQWSNDDPTTLNYEEGAGYGIMKRFDYGFNGTVGFETSNVIFSANYGLGMAKLQSGSNSSADQKNKHRVLSFTLAFKL
jgi:hypothetical protein